VQTGRSRDVAVCDSDDRVRVGGLSAPFRDRPHLAARATAGPRTIAQLAVDVALAIAELVVIRAQGLGQRWSERFRQRILVVADLVPIRFVKAEEPVTDLVQVDLTGELTTILGKQRLCVSDERALRGAGVLVRVSELAAVGG
jgi:hypothetical protein